MRRENNMWVSKGQYRYTRGAGTVKQWDQGQGGLRDTVGAVYSTSGSEPEFQ